MFGLKTARKNYVLDSRVDKFAKLENTLANTAEPTEKLISRVGKAETSVKESIASVTAHRGHLGENIKSMGSRFADVFRGTGKVTAAELAEKAAAVAEKPRAGFIQRVISKPFGWAAKSPKTAMVVGGLLAVVGIGSAIKHRQQKASDQALMNAMQQQAAYVDPTPTAQTTVSYKDSVSPDQTAQMEAQFRNSQGQAGFAENVTAARQAQAQGTPVAQL